MSEVMDIMLKIGVTEEVTAVFGEISKIMKGVLDHVLQMEKSFGTLAGRAKAFGTILGSTKSPHERR